MCGTSGYIAPEIYSLQSHTAKSDIFAVGSIMYSVLTQRNLFSGRNHKEVSTKNKECDLSHIDYKMRNFSEKARDFVRRLLHKNPAKRLTVQ